MPNHVRNVWTIKNLKKNEIHDILNSFTIQMEDDIYPLNCIIDFDKIIPEPRIKSECPADCIVNEDSHVESDKDRPWFDWYAWRNKYWNTKWGAYDSYTKIGKSQITFVFSTAWSLAFPVMERLGELVNHNIEVRYADEDLGSNCGKIEYDSKKKEWYDYELKNPYRFALNLWKKY